jgi:hypothetical protein
MIHGVEARSQPRPPGVPGAIAGKKPKPPKQKPLSETLPDDLKPEYQAAAILFHDGDSQTALVKFQTIYDKARDPRLLWNIAVCLKNLRHYSKAIEVFRSYITDPSDLVPEQDRRDAGDLVRNLTPFTTPIRVVVSEPGTQVWLDDEPIDPNAKGQLVVDIGTRKVKAKKEGFRPFEKELQVQPVEGGAATPIEIKMEKEGGHLDLQVPPDATVVLDDKALGKGPTISTDLSVGGHALKISAPKMRTYQGDVTIEDRQTRSLNITLEKDAEQFAELRVAVGCRDEEVRTPVEGLNVFLDGSNVSASPLGVRNQNLGGRDVAAFVPFTVNPGPHEVQIHLPTCDALTVSTVAAPHTPASVTGVLPPETPFFNGSPAGSPNGFRVSAGWDFSTVTFNNFVGFFPTPSGATPAGAYPQLGVGLNGPALGVGLEGRWLELLLDLRYLTGSTSGGQASNIQQFDGSMRFGLRAPLYYASLAGGMGFGGGYYNVAPSGGAGSSGATGQGFGWIAIDARPLCDWGLEAGFRSSFADGYASSNNDVQTQGEMAFFLHAVYEPNVLCSRKQGGMYQLNGQGTTND